MKHPRSPFKRGTRVRFCLCVDPACRCRGASNHDGNVGTVTYTRGLSILVDFPGNPMNSEIAFRKDAAKVHLTRAV